MIDCISAGFQEIGCISTLVAAYEKFPLAFDDEVNRSVLKEYFTGMATDLLLFKNGNSKVSRLM